MSIYTDVKAVNLEIDHHEADLYIKDTPKARAIMAKHDMKIDNWNVQPFTSEIDGARWLDLPFQYDPWWKA